MIRVKEQTRHKLKIWAAQHGLTMDEAIDKLLEIAQKQKDVTMEQSIKDYCSDREICCQNCRHIKDIMAGNGIPVFSCDCMYAAGAYNGSYVKQDIKTFACIEFEKKESSNG